MAKVKKDSKTEPESAVALPGAQGGGLGDFTTDTLLGSVETGQKGSATAEESREDMGRRTPRLEKIKVKHNGANLFEFPDENQVAGKDGFVGVIVGHTFHNTNFGKPFDEFEDGDRPICFSNDGVNIADSAEEPQSDGGCTACPFNRDARDKDARDKAFDLEGKDPKLCNNYFSMAVLVPGNDLPYVLRISNQSFGGWAEYVQQLLTRYRARPYEVPTLFKLRNIKKAGREFSVAVFEVAANNDGERGLLPKGLRESLKVQAVNYKALLQRLAETDRPDSAGASSEGAAAAKAAREAANADTQTSAGL